jgi:hypothetical protein
VPGIGHKAFTGPYIPLDPHLSIGELTDLNMHMGALRTEHRVWIEVRDAMLPLDRVIGLAAIDPVAIHTNAHAA